MLSAADNEALTRTGPDTAMGRVFRRYWIPALLAREVPDAGGPPVRVRLLGEDFIAFRDAAGQVGIVEPRCPHRGANLFFGRNERAGIRCAYHGWQFDVSGACVDIPTAPPELAARIAPKAAIRALQVREHAGIVWAWFGRDAAPDLPAFEFASVPDSHRYVSKKLQQCNWAQACEGGLDTAHFSFLHAGIRDGERVSLLAAGPRPSPLATGRNEPPNVASFRWMIDDPMPEFTIVEHAAGFVIGAARRTDDESRYWRCTQFLLPNHSLAPGSWPGGMQLGNTWVPIDDESCWIFCYAWNPDRPLTADERARLAAGSGIFPAMDEHFVPLRNRANDYLLDRTLQAESSFTGIVGISEQDAAIADSQGLIHDRTRELLGQTDLGVVRFRRAMLEAARTLAAGGCPRGAERPDAYAVRSGDAVAGPATAFPAVLEERFGSRWGLAVTANGR
jgi:nitrite reductase/ring-hydroxylating ferredoxin subunit